MEPTSVTPWSSDWAWGLILIVVTVAIHSFGLTIINHRVSLGLNGNGKNRLPRMASAMIVPGMALYASILQGFEGALWAAAYLVLGALPDRKSAMLYSLNAMTTYGHANIDLQLHWQLMGSLEALNGWILFGLTTAFLFTVMQKVWPHFNQST